MADGDRQLHREIEDVAGPITAVRPVQQQCHADVPVGAARGEGSVEVCTQDLGPPLEVPSDSFLELQSSMRGFGLLVRHRSPAL